MGVNMLPTCGLLLESEGTSDRFDSGRIVRGVLRIVRIAAAVVFVFA
jgi:hypothetical protein